MKLNLRRPAFQRSMKSRVALGLAVGTLATLSLAGCSSNQIDPSAVGLYYTAGMFEGKGFDHVVEPGSTDFTVNDNVIQLPTGQRSYIIRNMDGADVKGVISVPSKDNLLTDFEIGVAFKLNTRTDDRKDFKGGTLRKFYEEICRQYGCELGSDGKTSDGWNKMLAARMLPQIEAALKDEARKYDGDSIVGNDAGTLTQLQGAVGTTFQGYLERQLGARYFCGPDFDRKTQHECRPIELSIISADYNNPDVRKSREAKKVAADQANAQTQLQQALKDPNYLEYLRIQAMIECTKQKTAICIFNAAPGTNVSVNPPK